VIVKVFIRESPETVRRVQDEFDQPFVLLPDPDGRVAARYGVGQHPITVVVDRQGRLVGRVIGERDWGSPPAREWLASVLGPP
jgi:peroxiredoxin